jgi:hypothetical protein
MRGRKCGLYQRIVVSSIAQKNNPKYLPDRHVSAIFIQ